MVFRRVLRRGLRWVTANVCGRSIWPGSSPDLNVAENIGAIMKDRVEAGLLDFEEQERCKPDILRQTLEAVLQEISDDTELFGKLLKSYPRRLKAVKDAKGYHTQY